MTAEPVALCPDDPPESDHPDPEDPWTPEVLARFGPETTPPWF